MASEIEIVNLGNFEKIQNFLNDSAYKEILENSENFNTRLCIERRLRMPFLDPQTGVAQTHCALFVKQKQRMPGFRDGQIYTYPAARWRKPKRQYLLNHHHSYRAYQYREPHHHAHHTHHHHHGHPHQSSSSVGTRDHHQSEATVNTAVDGNSIVGSGEGDSKDVHANTEKEWFHEDMDSTHYHHPEDYDDDFDSDNDFDESYSSRGKRKRGSRSVRRTNANVDGTPKRGRKGGGSRRRNAGDSETGDRRRRGAAAGGSSVGANTSAAAAAAAAAVAHAASTAAASNLYANHSNSASPIPNTDETSQSGHNMQSNLLASTYDKSGVSGDPSASNDATSTVSNVPAPSSGAIPPLASGFPPLASAGATNVAIVASPKKDAKHKMRAEREVAQPSPYCDFCLGDQRENKKTNLPEELVSCSDCGRSGHPSCLQFTPNMIISVKRYRWQCIECKYCSICGTSDNDDQLLFCDDCDRGYHMYCLSPPLVTPPEGSWSCKLCMEEFHKHVKQSNI